MGSDQTEREREAALSVVLKDYDIAVGATNRTTGSALMCGVMEEMVTVTTSWKL